MNWKQFPALHLNDKILILSIDLTRLGVGKTLCRQLDFIPSKATKNLIL